MYTTVIGSDKSIGSGVICLDCSFHSIFNFGHKMYLEDQDIFSSFKINKHRMKNSIYFIDDYEDQES
jgi:hypothetical protein